MPAPQWGAGVACHDLGFTLVFEACIGQALHAFVRNLQVMLDVLTSPREVARNVLSMQAMLRAADDCDAVDAARAVRLREAAGQLIR